VRALYVRYKYLQSIYTFIGDTSYNYAMTIRIKTLVILLVMGLCCPLQADTASITITGPERIELSAALTDLVRENMIHIFDSSNFHQMPGGILQPKTQKQIEEQLEKIKSGSYIEVLLDEPARIVVESSDLKATCLWASITESNGVVTAWILKQPNGQLVSLYKPRGELALQFGPHVLSILKPQSEQAAPRNR
jgi:TusA-related sulfurtransferase